MLGEQGVQNGPIYKSVSLESSRPLVEPAENPLVKKRSWQMCFSVFSVTELVMAD